MKRIAFLIQDRTNVIVLVAVELIHCTLDWLYIEERTAFFKFILLHNLQMHMNDAFYVHNTHLYIITLCDMFQACASYRM